MPRRNTKFANLKRLLLTVSLTGVVAIAGCTQVGSSLPLGVLGIAGVSGQDNPVDEPAKSTIPEGALESRTLRPALANWDFVTSEEHYGSGAVLDGATCSKCHKDPSALARLWPYWANPPANHKDGGGCQTCHAVAPKPE